MTRKEIRNYYGSDTLDLYGKTFTWCAPSHQRPIIRDTTVYTEYGKPSMAKMHIWERWQEWKMEVDRDNNYIKMWVHSHNCNFFTIAGIIDTTTDEHYGFYITATRQEIWQILD